MNMTSIRTILSIVFLSILTLTSCGRALVAQSRGSVPVIDLSLMVSKEYPCTWPSWPQFQLNHHREIGPLSPYHIDILALDANTGTQMDTPPHSIPKPGSGLPFEGPAGNIFSEDVPAWQFGGEACVIDIRSLRGKAENGYSPRIEVEHIKAWEKSHRELRFGDVVLFRSDYSDDFYKPLPEGKAFVVDCIEKRKPGYPNPQIATMEYIGSKMVMHAGTDSPSLGTLPDIANEAHVAGLKHGGIFTESATQLGRLPTTGAFYCLLSPKHVYGAYAEARAIAITEESVASFLIDSVRNKRAVDLSVEMSNKHPVTWPGAEFGSQRHPYFRVDFEYAAGIEYWHHTRMFDSHVGTHIVPPSYALPEAGFDNGTYAPEVRGWLAEYEKKHGARGISDVTTEKVPVSQTCGWARVIDVTHLVGSTNKDSWPASPAITADHIRKHERERGPLKAGEIVVFYSGHTDRHFKPLPEGSACFADPLKGDSEGWPAPNADAIHYLASKGIACVGSDGPTLGGVDPKSALMTYWALGTRGMVGVEYLIHVGDLPREAGKAFFVFAPIKIKGCHGGPGRALAFY